MAVEKSFPEEVEACFREKLIILVSLRSGLPRTGGTKDGTEDIVAVIVPKEDLIEKIKDDNELERIVKEEAKYLKQLASYKRPINIIIRKEPLPKTTTRKS